MSQREPETEPPDVTELGGATERLDVTDRESRLSGWM